MDSAPVESVDARPGRWARLRAAAIAMVLLVECSAALPRDPFNHDRLARPEGQRLIRWIDGGLRALGRPVTRETIVDELVAGTESAVRARNALLAPFGPFFHYTSTHQQWGLFISAKRQSYRIHIDGRRGRGDWIAVYRAPGVVDRDGLAPALRYRRVRALYNPRLNKGVLPEYHGFVSWVAQRVLLAHPDYEAVRVRMERVAIGAPGTPLRTLGFEHETVRTRKRERGT